MYYTKSPDNTYYGNSQVIMGGDTTKYESCVRVGRNGTRVWVERIQHGDFQIMGLDIVDLVCSKAKYNGTISMNSTKTYISEADSVQYQTTALECEFGKYDGKFKIEIVPLATPEKKIEFLHKGSKMIVDE